MSKAKTVSVVGLLLCVLMFSSVSLGAEAVSEPQVESAARSDLATAFIAMGACLSVGLCALATGMAQSRIGSAGCGAIAEKPETAGTVILLVAIPETMVILGFVVAVVLLFTL